MIVSMAVAIKDGADLASGHKRKKAGDIIAVMPGGWQWGTAERKHYLIVNVDLGNKITDIADARKLEVPEYEAGDRWHPQGQGKIIGKRRYKIPLADLKSIASLKGYSVELNKVIDPNDDYQPLEKYTFDINSALNLLYDKPLGRKFGLADFDAIKGT